MLWLTYLKRTINECFIKIVINAYICIVESHALPSSKHLEVCCVMETE